MATLTPMYIYIYIYTSALRLLDRLTTCLAQITTASRLLFASTQHFVPQNAGKSENFRFVIFSNCVTHDDVIIR